MRANICLKLRDVIDENRFHNCARESEKALSDPVSTISLRTVDTALFAGRIASRADVLRGSSSAPVPRSEAIGRKARVRKIQ